MEDWGSISFVTVASFCGNYFCASLYKVPADGRARMLDAVRAMVGMRRDHPTKHADLVRE